MASKKRVRGKTNVNVSPTTHCRHCGAAKNARFTSKGIVMTSLASMLGGMFIFDAIENPKNYTLPPGFVEALVPLAQQYYAAKGIDISSVMPGVTGAAGAAPPVPLTWMEQGITPEWSATPTGPHAFAPGHSPLSACGLAHVAQTTGETVVGLTKCEACVKALDVAQPMPSPKRKRAKAR